MTLTPSKLIQAVLLHVVVMGLLFSGLQCSHQPTPPAVIEAVFIDLDQDGKSTTTPEARPTKLKPPKPTPPPPAPTPPPPPPDLAKQAAELEKIEKKAEQAETVRQQQVAKLETARLLAKQEADAKQLVEQQRKATAAEAAEEARKKAEADALVKQQAKELLQRQADEKRLKEALEAERIKQEVDNRRKAEAKAQLDALNQQLDAEAAARRAAAMRIVQISWGQLVKRAISQAWLRPPGNADQFTCKLAVKLLASGQVVNATITKSCGSVALDDSVIKAVYKASPLPLPSDPSAFDSVLNLTFSPDILK